MNCQEYQNKILEQLGNPEIIIDREHLENCSDCRSYYEEMVSLTDSLEAPTIAMTPKEIELLTVNLDREISTYVKRAFGFYNWTVRYGVSLAAMLLIVAVSLVSSMQMVNETFIPEFTLVSDEPYNTVYMELDELDDNYIDLVLDEYNDQQGSNAAELLIGEIDSEEYEYLVNNLKVGDIL